MLPLQRWRPPCTADGLDLSRVPENGRSPRNNAHLHGGGAGRKHSSATVRAEKRVGVSGTRRTVRGKTQTSCFCPQKWKRCTFTRQRVLSPDTGILKREKKTKIALLLKRVASLVEKKNKNPKSYTGLSKLCHKPLVREQMRIFFDAALSSEIVLSFKKKKKRSPQKDLGIILSKWVTLFFERGVAVEEYYVLLGTSHKKNILYLYWREGERVERLISPTPSGSQPGCQGVRTELKEKLRKRKHII